MTWRINCGEFNGYLAKVSGLSDVPYEMNAEISWPDLRKVLFCRAGRLGGSATATKQGSGRLSQLRQLNRLLLLVFPLLICVRNIAFFVRFKEQNLCDPFVGVNLRRQRGRI